MKSVKTVCLLSALLVGTMAFAQLQGTGRYFGPPGFDRGFQATTHCSNYPESWIRGSAELDQETGLLTMYIDLETDAVHAGPKGQVLVYVYDSNGNLLTRVASAEVSRGGKMPGRYERSTFQSSINLGSAIGRQARKMIVVANCTGFAICFGNVTLDQVKDIFGNIQQFVLFFF